MSDVLLSIQHDANNIVVAGSIFVALVVVTVAVRIISRFFMKIQYGIEDALLLIALAFYLVTVGLSFAAIISGSRADSETDALFADFLKVCTSSLQCNIVANENSSLVYLHLRRLLLPDNPLHEPLHPRPLPPNLHHSSLPPPIPHHDPLQRRLVHRRIPSRDARLPARRNVLGPSNPRKLYLVLDFLDDHRNC